MLAFSSADLLHADIYLTALLHSDDKGFEISQYVEFWFERNGYKENNKWLCGTNSNRVINQVLFKDRAQTSTKKKKKDSDDDYDKNPLLNHDKSTRLDSGESSSAHECNGEKETGAQHNTHHVSCRGRPSGSSPWGPLPYPA